MKIIIMFLVVLFVSNQSFAEVSFPIKNSEQAMAHMVLSMVSIAKDCSECTANDRSETLKTSLEIYHSMAAGPEKTHLKKTFFTCQSADIILIYGIDFGDFPRLFNASGGVKTAQINCGSGGEPWQNKGTNGGITAECGPTGKWTVTAASCEPK